MKLPTHRHNDTYRKTTWLYFDDEQPRESIIRGGICFPMRYKSITGKMENNGFALVAGQDIRTGVVNVYEQMTFYTIDDILATSNDPNFPVNAVKYPGLTHWFNRMWSEYFCKKYYYYQPEELSWRFRVQMSRSAMLNPKPSCLEIPIDRVDDLRSCIWYWVKSEKIRIPLDSELAKNITDAKDDDDMIYPSLHALGCCLVGFESYPWRQPYERPIQEVFIA